MGKLFRIFINIEETKTFTNFMRKILLTALFISASFAFGCGSKDDANGNRGANSNRGNANQAANDANSANMSSMDHNSMNHNSSNMNSNMASSSPKPENPDTMMHDMQSAPNAANAPYDLQFLDTMIAHHQAAVVMSKPALEKAQHAELKKMAQDIVTSQTKEIEQMQAWRAQWYKDQPPAINMDAAGMRDSMKSMDMTKLASASGNNFDLAFIQMMIPHHQGALSMAKEALEKAQHPELKTLARNIIMSQETEIESMQTWQKAWSGGQ
jgi:uncharacterized protein (DUF305 family)